MAKGGNGAALKLQKQSLEESKRASRRAEQIALMQMEALAAVETPKIETPAAPPTRSSADVERAGNDYRKRMQRRRGLNSTVYAGGAA